MIDDEVLNYWIMCMTMAFDTTVWRLGFSSAVNVGRYFNSPRKLHDS